MPRITTELARRYGAHPLQLLVLLGCFALVGYVVSVLGPRALWNPASWWQSILVWFVGAILVHDLVLFPLYALADRSLAAGWRALTGRGRAGGPTVSSVNYLRLPALGSALLFLLFFPGIVRQGRQSYLAATGQTQEPFLGRWLLLTAVLFGVSAVAYAVRASLRRGGRPR